MGYLISFLIPTLRERSTKFKSLTDKLFLQIEEHNLQNEVEVISIYDNRSFSLCNKRNYLQKICSGHYFLHMDDDDQVADDYCITCVNEIKKLMKQGLNLPDIITYNQSCEVNKKFFIVKTNTSTSQNLQLVGHEGDVNKIPIYSRCAWQYHLFHKKYKFIYRTESDSPDPVNKPHLNDDRNWIKKVFLENPKYYYNIDKILHYYYFDANGTGENKSTTQ